MFSGDVCLDAHTQLVPIRVRFQLLSHTTGFMAPNFFINALQCSPPCSYTSYYNHHSFTKKTDESTFHTHV